MEAPNVCAAVFRIRITAIGFSISFLNSLQIRPVAGKRSAITAILLGVMLKRAASIMEHKNETPNAMAILTIKSVIKYIILLQFIHNFRLKSGRGTKSAPERNEKKRRTFNDAVPVFTVDFRK